MGNAGKLILVDGSAFLFRAYHAIRQPLTTSAGETTHAVYGAVNMLRSLTREYKPTHIAVVMDAGGRTFREELFAAYKANRPPVPEDLRRQWGDANAIIEAMGLPLVALRGVEADDIIGTLTCAARAAGMETVIISGDKDLTQLVGEKVVMVDTMRDTRLDARGVEKKFGVRPELMVDYLTLVGDNSDNIPGVPGVGPKTAVRWLHEYGSLDKLVTEAGNIAGKVGEALRGGMEQLKVSRELVTLRCDIKLDVTVNDLQVKARDVEALRALYTRLEFRAWLRELDGEEGGDEEEVVYEMISDVQALKRWVGRIKKIKRVAVDTEVTFGDVHRAELVGVGLAVEVGEAGYLPLGHLYAGVPVQVSREEALEVLRPVLEDEGIVKVGHNIKYAVEVLRRHGVMLRGIGDDTMLMSYLLDAGSARHDLNALAHRHLGMKTVLYSEVAGSGVKELGFEEVDVGQAMRYAAECADVVLRLREAMAVRLGRNERLIALYREVELPLLEVLARIEMNGVKVDVAMLGRQSAVLAGRLKEVEAVVHGLAGETFNIASPKQIQEILYERLGLPVLRRTPKGQPSTAESVLQELAEKYELPRRILEYRSLAKLKGTYTDKLPKLVNRTTGRIHTSYHQAVASTGRLSSSDPNLQNIPVRSDEGKRIRSAFIAEAGCVLMSADYSQIELRIMAHLSGDAGLIAAFRGGQDVHCATAAEVFGVGVEEVDDVQRRRAKAINFGLIYGMSAFGLARQLHIEQQDARRYIDIYFERYPGVQQFMEDTKARAREVGYVETYYGRRLKLPEIGSKNPARRQYAERIAINAPMQGTAADLIKMAMLKVDEWINERGAEAKIIMQVHDELVLEVAEGEVEEVREATKRLMEGVATLKVPLVVDTGVGGNWLEAH